MREIQFRIWCSDNGDAPKMVYLDKMELDNGLWFHNPEEHTSDIHELMQYTGLKDRNGKEIYEGDFLTIRFGIDHLRGEKYIHTNMVVSWNESELCFWVQCDDGEGRLGGYFLPEYEVTGNIYESAL